MEATEKIEPTLGQHLRARRKQLGLSMKKLGQEVSVCEKTIHNWENDDSCFPVDKLMPMCRALRWTSSDLLRIDSDIDAGIKLQEARSICDAIRQITAQLRNIPDLTEAGPLMAERDRLREQIYELFDLPSLPGDGAAELARTEQWKRQKQPGSNGYRKNELIMRYIESFRTMWAVIRLHVSACWPAAGAGRAGA